MSNMNDIERYCRIVRNRSRENNESISLLYYAGHYGQVMSILRQELDSLVRCVYLVEFVGSQARETLVAQTLAGERWRYPGPRLISDREMVDQADTLRAWTSSIYKFGCAFIHLSMFHDYRDSDPFESLTEQEKINVKSHLNSSHGYDVSQPLTFQSMVPYLLMVYQKLESNLVYFVDDLERVACNR